MRSRRLAGRHAPPLHPNRLLPAAVALRAAHVRPVPLPTATHSCAPLGPVSLAGSRAPVGGPRLVESVSPCTHAPSPAPLWLCPTPPLPFPWSRRFALLWSSASLPLNQSTTLSPNRHCTTRH